MSVVIETRKVPVEVVGSGGGGENSRCKVTL